MQGALKTGSVTKDMLVASAQHTLVPLFSLGYANPKDKQPYSHLGKEHVNSAEHRQLNLEAAQQSIVLLRNDPVLGQSLLPLSKGLKIAISGPTSDHAGMWLGNYHPNIPSKGSKYEIIPACSAMKAAGFNATCTHGADINLRGREPNLNGIKAAADEAAASDVAIVFVGLDSSEEGEHRDRNATGFGLELPGDQQQLIHAVQQANPRTVVVLTHGSPIALDAPSIPAIVDVHYPGAMGIQALVDVLSGSYNPCGRLTTTVYPKEFVKRSLYDTGLRSDGGLTYMHYDGKYGEPLWQFGDGISYSNFSVKARAGESVSITTDALAKTPVKFSVEVANTAGGAGCYSVLGFVSSNHPEAPRNRKLFDYSRTNLEAGKSTVMTVSLTAATAALVEADGTSKLFPGTYTISLSDVRFTLKLSGKPIVVSPPPPLFGGGESETVGSLFV